MKKYTADELYRTDKLSISEALYNIKGIEVLFARPLDPGVYLCDDGNIYREDIKIIKTIKTKNDALLNFKHENDKVREYCKQMLRGE